MILGFIGTGKISSSIIYGIFNSKLKVRRTVTTFDDFKVGDMVEHSIFGLGKIMVLSGTLTIIRPFWAHFFITITLLIILNLIQ